MDGKSSALAARAGIRTTERLGYAAGDLASCLYYNTFSPFLMYFYTDVFGIGPAAVGTMLLVTRTWDNFLDPVMGMVADRTKTRWGKFRPWLLYMSAPLAIAGALTFTAQNFSANGKLVYAYITYSVLMLIYTAINIPYGALLGVITPDSTERTRFSSYRFLGAFSGNFVVQATLLWLVKHLGAGSERRGFSLTMTLYGVAAMLLFFFTFAVTRERVQSAADRASSIWNDLQGLLRNTPWLVLGLVSVLCLVWISVRNACLIYYFKYYVHNQTMTSKFMVIGTAATLLGVSLTSRIERLLGGKKSAYIWLTLVCGLTNLAMYFARPSDSLLMYASQIAGSFVQGPLFPMIWAMYADTADFAEWKFGRRTTGLIFSAGTFAQKMGWTVGGAIAGWLLGHYGFQANAAQNAGTLFGIRFMVSLLPAAVCVVTAIATLFYGINNKLEKRIGAELAIRREPGTAQLAAQ